MFYSSVTGFVVFLAAAVAFGFAAAFLAGFFVDFGFAVFFGSFELFGLPVSFWSFGAFWSAGALGFGEPAETNRPGSDEEPGVGHKHRTDAVGLGSKKFIHINRHKFLNLFFIVRLFPCGFTFFPLVPQVCRFIKRGVVKIDFHFKIE